MAREASRSWLLGTTVRRWRAQSPLLIGISAVTIAACSLVTTLGLLMTATEQSGVSASLDAIPVEQARIEVRLLDPVPSVAEARGAMDAAIATALGPHATFTARESALTSLAPTRLDSPNPSFAYFGDLDAIEANATLTEGEWPTESLSVAVPAAVADGFELGVGDSLTVDGMTVEVSGVFSTTDPSDTYWDIDYLHGAGREPAFPKPGVTVFEPVDAIGPLVVEEGGLDSAGLLASFVEVAFDPDLSATKVEELQPLVERLDDADIELRQGVDGVGSSVVYITDLDTAVSTIAAGLITTRSTVVVVSLLLLLIAIAAVVQTGRLFNEARASERSLMRSRGASSWHIVAFAIVEAAAIGFITAVASPFIASLLYRVFAAQPALVAAGMPSEVAPTAFVWATAVATSAIFVVVMIAPLIRRAPTVAEGTRARKRQSAMPAFLRSGVDVAALAVAGVALWQLLSYESVVDTTGPAVSIDPVLAGGPAVVLLGGALLAARVIPLVARLVNSVGSRGTGAVIPLASWEIGRRAQRATAAVLLLSLALAVGTFGLAFLSTWKQSQVDQAALAVGAPVRVPAESAVGLGTDAHPVTRRDARIGARDQFGEAMVGSGAHLLGLSDRARSLLDTGRNSELGGSDITRGLDAVVAPSAGFALPEGSTGVRLALAAETTVPLEGVGANMAAVLEDGRNELFVIDLGFIELDTEAVSLEGELPPTAIVEQPLRLVGVQARFEKLPSPFESLTDESFATVRVSSIDALVTSTTGDRSVEKVDVASEPVADSWSGTGPFFSPPPEVSSRDSLIEFSMIVPAGVQSRSASFAAVAWTPASAIGSVVSSELANAEYLQFGARMTVFVDGAAFDVTVDGIADYVPGAARSRELSAGGFGAASAAGREGAIVVDHRSLQRALVEGGARGSLTDEWWIDTDNADEWMSRHDIPEAVSSIGLARDLQESPLRIAVQVALWLVIGAALLLSTVGFAMHSAGTLRARRLDFAQLSALGLPRRSIVTLVGLEAVLLGTMGAIFGVAIGAILVALVSPLVAASPDGSAPVPSVEIQIPWLHILVLVSGLVAVIAGVVLVLSRGRSIARPAELLRWGGE